MNAFLDEPSAAALPPEVIARALAEPDPVPAEWDADDDAREKRHPRYDSSSSE